MMSAFSRAAMFVVQLLVSAGFLAGGRQREPCRRRQGRPRQGDDVPGLSRPRRTVQDPRRAEHRRPDRALSRCAVAGIQIGARKNDAMSVVAPSLSDKDIEDLAAYFSAIEISVGKLPGQ